MATSDWSIPTGKAITGTTYIKDTDNNIAATIEDLVDWCNNANGTYNDYTLTGLRTDFLSVSTAQAITSVKTVDTAGAIDFTNGELRIGGVAVTSTAAELNLLDGVTATTSELNILDGVTATTTELNYVDGVTSSIQTQIDGKLSSFNVVDDTTPQLGGDLDYNGKTANKSSVRGIADATPSTGTTHTFDYSNGDMQQVTCPAAGTLTLAISNMPTGSVSGFIVDIINGGNCEITYPAGMLFQNGVKPRLTVAGTDRLMIMSDKDGVTSLTVVGYNLGTV